ncbi:TIGR03792 family protein [Oscillatoria salina]|uniref:TIGR03792 family protein n=1 Tax=Oscillatoria salina TaxID=331517 RepID=UPI001CCA970C|nr:TIGR03792 family protein [Oscillatoria salina]MBZ8180787.1 TIGR03792 family protein [Oscillatoria salina IIICB1]
MVIEWLRIKVAPEAREKYIQKDAEIWTPMLTRYPGFLGKEVWLNPEKADEVVLIIRWRTRQEWSSVPIEDITETEKQFDEAMGDTSHQIVESLEYQVRKFPQGRNL